MGHLGGTDWECDLFKDSYLTFSSISDGGLHSLILTKVFFENRFPFSHVLLTKNGRILVDALWI